MEVAKKLLAELPKEEQIKVLVSAIAEKHQEVDGTPPQQAKTDFKDGDEVIVIANNRICRGTFLSWNKDGSWVKVVVGEETLSFPAGCVADVAELRVFKLKRARNE